MTNPNAGLPTPPPLTSGVPAQPSIPSQVTSQPEIPAYTIDVSPNHPPDQKTLVYSPNVQILIAHGNTQYDVSNDLVACSVQRNENSVSTLTFRLTNKATTAGGKPRYNQLFERMDRVVCMMKRVTWIQVFSGYLDRVPYVQIYPGTVNFVASCTLKRILHTWWDPGLPASTKIFDQYGISSLNEAAAGESANVDAGLGALLRRFLVKVGGWNSSNIHIQLFPPSYYLFMEAQIKQSQQGIDKDVAQFKRDLLGDDISLGTWGAAGQTTGVNQGSYAISGAGDSQTEVIKAVDDMGMGPDNMAINASSSLSTSAQQSTDPRDKAAWQDSSMSEQNWEKQGKQSDAAIHCFMTIMVESNWRMLANNAVPESLTYPNVGLSTDGTSVGLYQQTEGNGWGTVAQRMNVRESTQMFLQKLNGLNWRNMDRGTACQAVQASAVPGAYATQEQAAIQAVQTLRGNQTPSSGASPTTNPAGAGTSIPGLPNVTLPSVPGISPGNNNLTAVTNAGTPQGAAATATNRPQHDTQGAIMYARSQLGKPYVWGAEGPASFDCSGLTMMAYKSIGIDIGHYTGLQYNVGQKIPASQAKPGDLMFPGGPDEHVVMVSDTPGMIIEASQPGTPIHEVPNYAGPDVACVHIPSTEWGGPGAATFNPFPTGPGAAPGTVQDGPNGTSATTSAKEPIARNLFTYMFVAPAPDTSMLLGSQPGEEEKAFVNDQSMMPTVKSMAFASLRNFQSLPNGDFAAYYPDYFGMDGKRAVLTLRDIEMKNVQIDLNDDALCTHAYVAGSQMPQSGSMGLLGWIQSQGFATVENEWLFKRMTLAAPTVKGSSMSNGKDIMRRFGVRPLIQEMPMIQRGPMEFLCAVALFMQKWAEQYSTQVELTFMPELYPGQRILLDGHNLQVYVSQVTHNCDFENGFTTTATIMAPSAPDIGNMVSSLVDLATQSNFNLLAALSGAATSF